MTAVAAVTAAPLRPVAWSRLGWVAWRRYRTTIAATILALAAVGSYLVIDGKHIRSAYAAYVHCRPVHSAPCEFAWQNLHDGYAQPGFFGILLLFLPAVIGAFAGAPVLARELETGTFRYAWTQGVGRTRWALTAIVPGAAAVTGVMGAFGALASWHNRPLVQAGINPRLRSTDFPVTGLAAAGWALLGFALGVVAGLVWRRVIAGLATALAAWFGLALLTADVLRPHYLTQLTTSSLRIGGRNVTFDQWWDKGGVRVSNAEINSVLRKIGFQEVSGGGKVTVHPGSQSGVDPYQYLVQHGYTQVTSYQPDSRYWTFQWIEFGWLTALAVLLLGAGLWLVRRRPA